MAIDPTPINGAAGLVKSHTVTQDSETTVMRSGKDILETAQAAAAIGNSCNRTARRATLGSIFGMRARSATFRENSAHSGEFNTKDGELNG